MTLPQHDAVIVVEKHEGAVRWRGQPHFFRGHTLAGRGVDGCDGIYAHWHWDGRELIVRNDRYGVAPLFFVAEKDRVAVSPSIATLLAQGAPATLDDAAIAVFLRLGFFVGDDTAFRHIRAVPPATTFSWKDGQLSVTGGYTTPRAIDVSRDQALDGFVTLFHEAMACRLPEDDRAVVPLSGGRDSRHILFELCALGRPPRCAVTILRDSPRPHEDERIAPLVAHAAGVPHRLLHQDGSPFDVELARNWDTHLCADEHAWYLRMVEALDGAKTVYDGLGGALSVPSRFLSTDALRLFESGHTSELARRLLDSFSRFNEAFLGRAVAPDYREGTAREPAVARLATELARHAAAPDPVKSFNFWNRIRRELALVPYALMRRVPFVFTPYLDRRVYDFLMALAPTVIASKLQSADKSFHDDAIHRAFPQHSHIPFTDKAAPAADRSSADRAGFAAAVARYLFANRRVESRVLNRRYVFPRLAFALLRRRYRESRPWLPSLALYLFQLDAAAAGLAGATRLQPWRLTKSAGANVELSAPDCFR
jgi:hypothetical protein